MDKMTPSYGYHSPSQPPCAFTMAQRQSGHHSRDGDYVCAQQHGLALIKVSLAIVTVECPIYQTYRPTLHLHWHYSLEEGRESSVPG